MSWQLVGGQGPWEGRLEMTLKGVTGTVCDDMFGQEEADVACVMLGFR